MFFYSASLKNHVFKFICTTQSHCLLKGWWPCIIIYSCVNITYQQHMLRYSAQWFIGLVLDILKSSPSCPPFRPLGFGGAPNNMSWAQCCYVGIWHRILKSVISCCKINWAPHDFLTKLLAKWVSSPDWAILFLHDATFGCNDWESQFWGTHFENALLTVV